MQISGKSVITPQMVKFFKKRMLDHIDLLFKHVAFTRYFLPEFLTSELFKRARFHDRDKYTDSDLFEPYVVITWYNKLKNEGKPVPTTIRNAYQKAQPAILLHTTTNEHHPEAHSDITTMSKLDLAEMVCDWSATAEEVDGTSARSWASSVVGSKYKFSPKQEDFIWGLIEWFEKLGGTKQ